MALDPKAAALALHRFGLGPRPGSIAAMASDPRGALLAEIAKPDAGRVPNADLLSSVESSRVAFDFRADRQAKMVVAKREADRMKAMDAPGGEVAAKPPELPAVPDALNPERQNFL